MKSIRCSPPHLLWILLIGVAPRALAAGAELSGRITATDTGHGLEAAEVRLRSGGASEMVVPTDVFGFYRLSDIEPGSYSFEATHPGYVPYAEGSLALAEGERAHRSPALTPRQPHEALIAVYVSVSCAATGLELANVPVEVLATPVGNQPAFQGRLITDRNGYRHFRGAPKGFYKFWVNDGVGARPGWATTVQQPMASLETSHWVEVQLKPIELSLLVSVYGYNPVTQQDNVPLEKVWVELTGVHPGDWTRVLVPTQTGVSGLRKDDDAYWDNTMAGKVRFTGLPPIDWQVVGKRLGYRPATQHVAANDQAQLVPDQLRLDMALLDTRLTAVFDSPYNDPAMLAGLPVLLQGLTNSNTQGIERQTNIVFEATASRAVAKFDRLLPGRYRLSVNGVVHSAHPVLIEGKPLSEEVPVPLSVRLAGTEYVEAVGDRDSEAGVVLGVEPVIVRGRLLLKDVEHHLVLADDPGQLSFYEHPATHQPLEFRVSEYFAEHLPAEHHRVQTQTDANGEFIVSLLPGPYGVLVAGLDDYVEGGAVVDYTSEVGAPAAKRNWLMWPHFQRWPFTRNELINYSVLYVCSGYQHWVDLTVLQDVMNIEYSFNWPAQDPTSFQIVSLRRANPTDRLEYEYEPYRDFADGSVLLASGGAPVATGRLGGWYYRFEDIGPGTGYHFIYQHPRYQLKAEDAAKVFDYEDHKPPGVIPTNAPPRYWPGPMNYYYAWGRLEYMSPSTALFTVKEWDSERRIYVEVAKDRKPDFFKVGYAGERLFKYVQVGPSTAYEAWLDLTTFFDDQQEHWYAVPCEPGTFRGVIYIGGTQAEESAPFIRPPLRQAYTLKVLARNEKGQREYLDGVEVFFEEGGSVLSGSPPAPGRIGSHDVTGAKYAGWEYAHGAVLKLETVGDVPIVTVTVNMRQGITLSGKLLNRATGMPIANAAVRLAKAQGQQPEALPPSAADGSFAYNRILAREVYFLDIHAPGFAPHRRRLSPDTDLNPPGGFAYQLEGDQAIRLEPLPAPVVLPESMTVDRFGAFLPGVKRAGNQDAFQAFVAEGPLTATWRLQVRKPPAQSVEFVNYDSAAFDQGSVETIRLEDELDQVWLVDQRQFPKDPYSDWPQVLALPDPAEPHLRKDWLARILVNHTNTPNVFRQRLTELKPTADTNVFEAIGQVKLWQLPPGEFKPVLVAVSRRGAVAVHPFAYAGAYAGKELTGFRLPQWMATVADVMGVIAGVQGLGERIEGLAEAFPMGRFFPLPTFTAEINLEPNNYLNYRYLMDVNLIEGLTTPDRGLIGMALGTVGFDLFAGLEAMLQGEDREFYLRVRGGVGTKAREEKPPKTGTVEQPEVKTPITPRNVNRKALTPKFVPKLLPVVPELDPYPKGEIAHVTSVAFGKQGETNELQVAHEIQGEVGGRLRLDLVRPLVALALPIPQLALALEGARASGNLGLDGYLAGLIGLRSRTIWLTTFPHDTEHYSKPRPEDRQWRRHFLGGDETGAENGQRLWDLCFRFGGGLACQVANRVGARIELAMAGDDCWTGQPALRADSNPDGDWPPIKRIRGHGALEIETFAKLWRLKFGKRWELKFLPIDAQLGTATQFDLTPIETFSGDVRAEDFDPAVFDRVSPQVLRHFLPLGTYDVAAGDPAALIYIDMLEGRQDMALRVATRSGPQSWNPPALLAHTAGAIIDAAVARRRDSSGWLAVWTEIAPQHVHDYYPPSSLWYATTETPTGAWSDPRQLTALDEVADHLTLAPLDQGLALVFLENGQGAQATDYELKAAVWDGQNWTPPHTLLPGAALTGFAVAGSPDSTRLPLHVVWVNANAELLVLSWNGQVVTPPLRLAENAGNDVSLAAAPDAHYLTWASRAGGLGLFSFAAGAGDWLATDQVFALAQPSELQVAYLDHPTDPLLLHVWIEGGTRAALWYAYTSPSGQVLGEPVNLTGNTRGAYYHPAIIDTGDREASVTALFRNDPLEELRVFDLAYPTGPVRLDRDGDQLNDLRELLIVDGDPLDALETIDQVTPGGDFDQDGFPDEQELALGSDPADPASYPALQVVLEPAAARTAGAQWRLEGGEWRSSGQACYLVPGEYRIEFGDSGGWSTPRPQTVVIERGLASSLIVRYLQGGVTFEGWAASLAPPLPPALSGPDAVNGPLGLPNFAAYALGLNPLTATPDLLPSLVMQGTDLVYTYPLSKLALEAAYRVSLAPALAAQAWRDTDAAAHRQVGETADCELWQLRLSLPDQIPYGFLKLDVLRVAP